MSFESDLDKAFSFAQYSTEEIYKEACIKMCEVIIDSTPVDTGALKGAWVTEANSPRFVHEPNRLDPDGVESKAEARDVFKSANVESDIYFTNGLDYADLMESGDGSKQAPEGMVSVNIRRWPFIVADFSRRFV